MLPQSLLCVPGVANISVASWPRRPLRLKPVPPEWNWEIPMRRSRVFACRASLAWLAVLLTGCLSQDRRRSLDAPVEPKQKHCYSTPCKRSENGSTQARVKPFMSRRRTPFARPPRSIGRVRVRGCEPIWGSGMVTGQIPCTIAPAPRTSSAW